MRIYKKFNKIIQYIICGVLGQIMYDLLCAVFDKDRICFIMSPASIKYMNIHIIYERIKNDVKCVAIDDAFSLNAIFQIARSRIIMLDQSSNILKYIKIHGKTACIQIWHSSGWYKRVGYDALRDGYDRNNEIKRVDRLHGYIDYFVISDRKFVPLYAKAFNLPEERILPLGLVRTDRYYSIDVKANRQAIHDAFPETQGKKILLYAPTFRQNRVKGQRDFVHLLDIDKLRAALGKEWCFAVREHPSAAPADVLPGWLDFTHMDQDVCLSVADILITDYSSILFDYAFFRRPILLYVSDIDDYVETQRKIYLSPEELVGSACVCRTPEDVINAISQNAFAEHKIWERFMEDCDGHSSERVADFVKKTFLEHSP